ncbi:hypothetical protein [Legionella parisiensis]|uniref:Uncharacterized protein n=1 Tax=Legionella parisiensis TaxID=45071 RepID=A0A1E5JUW1_9GAMM|nr:hypothetical protein [Legionella parisiensis]KTD41109.1 hypothetical protein Lpar_2426 [Legionella parisiensis]OEH48322.1 hypothetical protein lpari_00578 [Legionella parisiensis]STX76593.1 Uncharacterised protein [Legionella parisiensis]
MKKNMQMIQFGFKRFFRYFLIGIICSFTPVNFAGFSIILPALILFSIILSIDDVSLYKHSVNYPPTFLLSYWGVCVLALVADWVIWQFKLI